MTPAALEAATGARPDLCARYAPHITTAMALFGLFKPAEQAMFIAQIAHESGLFTRVVESLNYSVDGLRATFPTRITAAEAARLGRQPGEKSVPIDRQTEIARLAYGGRYGNDTAGDGYRYRGRGLKQVTFRGNYEACGKALGIDLVNKPELLDTDRYAAQSAGWFWKSHDLNSLADRGDFTQITRIINGGLNGLAEREALWRRAQQALGA